MKNPKLSPRDRKGYAYYAGYASSFVESLLSSWDLSTGALVLDPWNGSGTTTSTAGALGFSSVGLDLNPAAVILARGRLLDPGSAASLRPLAEELLEEASWMRCDPYGSSEPLAGWFEASSARRVRRIEAAVQKVLVHRDHYHTWSGSELPSDASSLASFYLTALFAVVRKLISAKGGSNPTWVRTFDADDLLRVSYRRLRRLFLDSTEELASVIRQRRSKSTNHAVWVGDSRSIPLSDDSVSAVVTSPPYCTRLDYIVATLPELAVLGCHPRHDAQAMRRKMIGSPLTPRQIKDRDTSTWGDTCRNAVDRIKAHSSKASKGYYARFYEAYFAGLSKSLEEIDRVIAPGAKLAFVVQDSHYKDISVPLGKIVTEMGVRRGWRHQDTTSFEVRTPLVRINPRARKYLKKRKLAEHVVTFEEVA